MPPGPALRPDWRPGVRGVRSRPGRSPGQRAPHGAVGHGAACAQGAHGAACTQGAHGAVWAQGAHGAHGWVDAEVDVGHGLLAIVAAWPAAGSWIIKITSRTMPPRAATTAARIMPAALPMPVALGAGTV
jgi:hypothetical protein